MIARIIKSSICFVLSASMIMLPACRTRQETSSEANAIDFTSADWYSGMSDDNKEKLKAASDTFRDAFQAGDWEIYDQAKNQIDYETYAQRQDKEENFYIVSPKNGDAPRIALTYRTKAEFEEKKWNFDAHIRVLSWPAATYIGRTTFSFNSTDSVAKQKLTAEQGFKHVENVVKNSSGMDKAMKNRLQNMGKMLKTAGILALLGCVFYALQSKSKLAPIGQWGIAIGGLAIWGHLAYHDWLVESEKDKAGL